MSDAAFWQLITGRADEELDELVAGRPGLANQKGHRGLMVAVKAAVACYLNPLSRWHRQPSALLPAREWLDGLIELQAEDGLFRSGDNLASPPDSCFTLNDVACTYQLLTAGEAAGDPALDPYQAELIKIIERITPALIIGGLHTPNHRWEVASALTRVAAIKPDPAVARRIEDWLAEGIDAAPDGLYSERSANYAAHVTNPSLILMGRLLKRGDLIEIGHRNLHAQAALTDPDGQVETVYSRRQDQRGTFDVGAFLTQFRYFAVLEGCTECAAMARLAESAQLHPITALAELLEEPRLGEPLPDGGPSTGSGNVRRFESAGLARIHDGASITTIYGGSDVPAAGRIASGLACNPTFLRWRSGAAVLESVRLSRDFFGIGPFRADGLTWTDGVAQLRETVGASYYQPLPEGQRQPDGRYALEFEGRFAAAMAFSERGQDRVELRTEIAIEAVNDRLSLNASFAGVATSYAFELCFRAGGTLEGLRPLDEPGTFELVDGHGSYRYGDDLITFGPGGGTGPDQPPRYDPGEAYTFLRGTDAVDGLRVYITGRTPGEVALSLARSSIPGS